MPCLWPAREDVCHHHASMVCYVEMVGSTCPGANGTGHLAAKTSEAGCPCAAILTACHTRSGRANGQILPGGGLIYHG
jgi:hypothetical protein